MIDWAIDTAFLAAMGDRNAQIEVALIVGGMVAFFVGLHILSILRVVMSPSRRRKVHSLSDMGFN